MYANNDVNIISQHWSSFVPLPPNVVPMDLDVKMKAVVLAATFLIVSTYYRRGRCVGWRGAGESPAEEGGEEVGLGMCEGYRAEFHFA